MYVLGGVSRDTGGGGETTLVERKRGNGQRGNGPKSPERFSEIFRRFQMVNLGFQDPQTTWNTFKTRENVKTPQLASLHGLPPNWAKKCYKTGEKTPQKFLESDFLFKMIKKVRRSAEKFSEPFPSLRYPSTPLQDPALEVRTCKPSRLAEGSKIGNSLGQNSCRTKVSRIFRFFVPNFAPNFALNFPRIFWGVFVLHFAGDGDQKKFTKNPRHFSMQNSQANSKKKSTKFFWRAVKVRIPESGYERVQKVSWT